MMSSIGFLQLDVKPRRAVLVDPVDRHDRIGCDDAFNGVGRPACILDVLRDFALTLCKIALGYGQQPDTDADTKFKSVRHD